MSYRPGDIFYNELITANISGASVNADITPWATLTKNGIDDTSVKVFVNNVDVGRYVMSGVIPNTYTARNSIGVVSSGLFAGILSKTYNFLGVLESSVPDVNVLTVSGVPVSPGMSGSFLADLRYINGGLTSTYQGIAQTGSATSMRLQSNEPSTDNYYQWAYVSLVDGKGVGQQAIVTSYSGSTKDVYVQTPYSNGQWLVVPDNTTKYAFTGLSAVSLEFMQNQLVTSGAGVNFNNFFNSLGKQTSQTVDNFVLGSGGIDSIMIENNVNFRQWASVIGAAIAGSSTISSNNISFYAINNNAITRLTATAVSGARQAVVLFLP